MSYEDDGSILVRPFSAARGADRLCTPQAAASRSSACREGVKPTEGTRRPLSCPQGEFVGLLPSPRAALTLTSDTVSGSSVSSFKLKLFLLETWRGERNGCYGSTFCCNLSQKIEF